MLCENTAHLNDHMRVHTEDGDWTCNNCSFQTNSKTSLRKHLQLTKHVSSLISVESNYQSSLENNMKQANHSSSNIPPPKQISCKQCHKVFNKIEDLKTHRITNHKTYKPCSNLLTLGKCKYEDECIYKHNKLKENDVICYQCGSIYTSIEELMIHRKTSHEMKPCIKYKNNI